MTNLKVINSALPKLLFLAILGVAVLASVYLVVRFNSVGQEAAKAQESLNTQPSVFKEVSKPIYMEPIEITFLDTKLKVEPVGVEGDGTLSVPTSWYTAGWYEDGPKAGEEGNIIIDGHYDTATGSPGAFWDLKNLSLGDTVALVDKLGRVYTYVVDNKYFVDITDPKRTEVFKSTTAKTLTLITCGGVWDYASGTYNKRLVVTAHFRAGLRYK